VDKTKRCKHGQLLNNKGSIALEKIGNYGILIVFLVIVAFIVVFWLKVGGKNISGLLEAIAAFFAIAPWERPISFALEDPVLSVDVSSGETVMTLKFRTNLKPEDVKGIEVKHEYRKYVHEAYRGEDDRSLGEGSGPVGEVKFTGNPGWHKFTAILYTEDPEGEIVRTERTTEVGFYDDDYVKEIVTRELKVQVLEGIESERTGDPLTGLTTVFEICGKTSDKIKTECSCDECEDFCDLCKALTKRDKCDRKALQDYVKYSGDQEEYSKSVDNIFRTAICCHTEIVYSKGFHKNRDTFFGSIVDIYLTDVNLKNTFNNLMSEKMFYKQNIAENEWRFVRIDSEDYFNKHSDSFILSYDKECTS